MQKDDLTKIEMERKPGSLAFFKGEIPFEYLEKEKAAAVEAISKEITIDGFRKGHVPESVLAQKVGEMTILNEMAERALRKVYAELVAFHELDVIGYPNISITKLAKGNPLGFTLEVAVVPPVTLPDYEKIAKDINKEKESREVTEEEVTKQVEDILRQKVAYERLQKKAAHSHEGHDHEHHEGHEHSHDHDHVHEEAAIEKPDEVNAEGGEGGLGQDIKLPELTDDYVKGLGKPGQFTSVEDFRNKVKEHLTIEKARDVDSRHRAKITDAIIEKSEMDLPQVLLDAEINQMFAQMEEDLKRAQLTIEDYLTHIKKTKDDLKKEWTPSAEKRAKLQLVLNAIAKKADVKADPSLVDHEVSHLLEQYKDADEKRVRIYVNSVLTNEAVMKKLEDIA